MFITLAEGYATDPGSVLRSLIDEPKKILSLSLQRPVTPLLQPPISTVFLLLHFLSNRPASRLTGSLIAFQRRRTAGLHHV
jgi:hypothetical protein